MKQADRLEQRGWPDEAVRGLIERAQNGDRSARDEVVQANLRLVHSLVARFSAVGQEAEDLFQIGCIGLLKAVDRFDLSFDVRFSTYAVPLILGEIRRHLRDDGPLRVSRSLKVLAAQARKVTETMRAELGREPALSEVAERLGVQPDELVEAMDGARPPASIHQQVHEGEGDPIFLIDKLSAAPEGGEGRWIDRVALRDGLARLSPRERTVIMLRFFRDKTQVEIANLLGVSQVQISRLERRALEQIRQFMGAPQT